MKLSKHPTWPDSLLGDNGHTYPDGYAPGQHWALDEAWGILDTLDPDVISPSDRAWIAGQIAGTLMRIAKEGAPKKVKAD